MRSQPTLPGFSDWEPDAALLVSIQPEHAARIYSGSKLFELRKTLPRAPFSRVYLYESGTGLVSGCFDVAQVIEKPVQELWAAVGEAGATRERFFAYFAGSRSGFAVEVRAPIHFRVPVPVASLRRADARFRVPISSALLRDTDPALSLLEQKRRQELSGLSRVVVLRRIADAERDLFVRSVTQEVSSNYADITDRFAQRILEVHDAGTDENGFLTNSKEVLSICTEGGALIGYTSLTYKAGGSIKTGPTLLFPEYRRRGYGIGLRFALERFALDRRARKLYCTCPDRSRPVLENLLACGYRIEAHLKQHYSLDHSEFILGKVLSAGPPPTVSFKRTVSRSGRVVPSDFVGTAVAAHFIFGALPTFFAGVPLSSVRRMVEEARAQNASAGSTDYERKPRQILMLHSGQKYSGAAVLMPKRGGCVKLALLATTAHTPSIKKLLLAAEWEALRANARKIYCVHPLSDVTVVELLYAHSFVAEGVLREPYREGVDTVVMSKQLRAT